jgi:hypothetical protein
MLFRDPVPLNLDRSHQESAYLAGMNRPLLPSSVTGKNFI